MFVSWPDRSPRQEAPMTGPLWCSWSRSRSRSRLVGRDSGYDKQSMLVVVWKVKDSVSAVAFCCSFLRLCMAMVFRGSMPRSSSECCSYRAVRYRMVRMLSSISLPGRKADWWTPITDSSTMTNLYMGRSLTFRGCTLIVLLFSQAASMLESNKDILKIGFSEPLSLTCFKHELSKSRIDRLSTFRFLTSVRLVKFVQIEDFWFIFVKTQGNQKFKTKHREEVYGVYLLCILPRPNRKGNHAFQLKNCRCS